MTITRQIAITEIVAKNNDDVRLQRRGCRDSGEQEQKQNLQTHALLLPAAAGDFKSGDTEVRLVGISGYDSSMPDDNRRIRPVSPGGGGGGGGDDGPSTPKVEKPNTDDILKKMRKVDPEQAKRYRQRTGE